MKTGSGAFLRKRADAEFLAALMVATAETAGTRTIALMTDMGQPLGHTAGNWIEVAECVQLLRGETDDDNADLRELSLRLAGWMIHLGGRTATAEQGYWAAAGALADGTALKIFLEMIRAQGGDISVFDNLKAAHHPGATLVLEAWRTGYVAAMGHNGNSAGRCSGSEPDEKKRESPSIPTPASSSMPAAEPTFKKASLSPPSTQPTKPCSLSPSNA